MHLLIYDWSSYLQRDIKMICHEKGVKTTSFSWIFVDKNVDEKFEKWFIGKFSVKCFDALFSINYWPILSVVAKKIGLKYIAWCYDNPLNVERIEESLGNSNNYVIMFDKIQANKYISAGFDAVYYHPLCVNTKRYSRIVVSEEEKRKYNSDVSFVGSLYESRISEIKGIIDDYSKGYVDALIDAQQEIYGCYMLDDIITDAFINDINKGIKERYPGTKFRLLKEALTFAMASEITRRDRIMLLSILGKRFDTKLYSHQEHELLGNVKMCQPIDYVDEMPKVFRCSKINLNPVLRCIQSGIPLRALDIMASGGFLLSSYQSELVEYFVQDKEVVLYESIGDAIEKVQYYLIHDDTRKQIIQAGRKKVFEKFALADFWDKVLEICEQ